MAPAVESHPRAPLAAGGPAAGASRIAGLDAIRFVAAFVVLMRHVGVPSFFEWMSLADLPPGLPRLVRDFFDGSAAVTVFFIISGFCIHLPVHRADGRVQAIPFLAGRGLRILPPYAIAYALCGAVGMVLAPTQGVFWTLICELIYYLLYPALLALRRRMGTWRTLLAAAFVGAVAVAWIIAWRRPGQTEIFESNVLLSAVHGLPFWLLGCVLAERFLDAHGSTPPPSSACVLFWRLGLMAAVGVMLGLQRLFQIGHIWSLLLFAPLALEWLHVEIRHAQQWPCRWGESLGRWSYSLYVVHMPAFALLSDQVPWRQIVGHASALGWVVQMGGVLLLAWLFHLAVERPSHALARRVAHGRNPPADPRLPREAR